MKNTITRTSISLPAHLRDRMAASEEINWSKIARQAFEAHLGNGVPAHPDYTDDSPIEQLVTEIKLLRIAMEKIAEK